MFSPDYEKTLELAMEIHKSLVGQIDFNTENVKRAVYCLQGGALTQAYISIKSWEFGDYNTPFRCKRFIDESSRLITLFICSEKVDKYLRRFFNDEIIDPPNLMDKKNLKLKESIMNRYGMGEDYMNKWIEVGNRLYSGFSKGIHVTYRASSFNMDVFDNTFNYRLEGMGGKPFSKGFDFATFIIIPAIDTLLSNRDIFNFDTELIDTLNYARNFIQVKAVSK